jgi:hypothetical protein
MLTLSYPAAFPNSGTVVKYHWNQLRTNLKRWYDDFSYVWVLEFQKRGAPHFHVLNTLDPRPADRIKVADRWAKIVAGKNVPDRYKVYQVHRFPKQWEKFRLEDGAKRYILKYALKPYQKEVPHKFWDVGRFWGCSYDVRKSIPDPKWAFEADDAMVRELLADHPCLTWDHLPSILFGVPEPAPYQPKDLDNTQKYC